MTASREFQNQLTDFLPKMRIWAMALTRNRTAAEDLVQEVAMKVLMACDSYVPGTNFSAWVHRIMVNQFITNVRRQREYNDLDQIPEVGMRGAQEDQSDLRELNLAFRRLPADQKDALRWIAVEERSYEEVSDTTGCAIGTLKSRVHRAEVSYVRRDQGGRLRRRPRGPSEQAEAPHCQTDQGRSNMVGPNRGRNVRGKEYA
jgi:RNA polymerase sigma-70 factor (ECF subfamily)